MQILVLGMHRSGTSTVSRILNLMGIYFGAEGISTGANEENKKGFWERKDVRELNDFILQKNDFDWYKISNLNKKNCFSAETLDSFHKRAGSLILDMDAHRPWFLKEPRLCLTKSLWEAHLEVPLYIFVYRNPVEVAMSLQERNSFPIDYGLKLWQAYNISALKNLNPNKTHFISYNELMKNPKSEMKKLNAFLSRHEVPTRMLGEMELNKFIDPSLYRQHAKNLEWKLPTSMAKLFEDLKNNTIPNKLIIKVDSILSKYENSFEKTFSFEGLKKENGELLKGNNKLTKETEEKTSLLNALRLDLKTSAELTRKKDDEIRKRNDQIEKKEDELRRKDDQIRGKEDELRKKDDQIRGKEDELRRRNEIFSVKEDELRSKFRDKEEGVRIKFLEKIDDLKTKLQDHVNEISKKDQRISQDTDENRSLKIQILGISDDLKMRNEIIGEQNIQLEFKTRKENDNLRVINELKTKLENKNKSENDNLRVINELKTNLKNKNKSENDYIKVNTKLENYIKDLHSQIKSKDLQLIDYWNQIQSSRITNRLRGLIGLKAKGTAEIDIPIEKNFTEVKAPTVPTPVTQTNKPKVKNKIKPDVQPVTKRLNGSNQEIQPHNTTVIIPVYNAHDDIIKCIDSAIATVGNHNIIIINDASPDERIVPLLKEYESQFKNITLILNETNLGYTRSINIAINACSTDIVLVNSDTILTRNWLQLLEESAYIDNRIGSVTAISNNAGAFSVPEINKPNDIPEQMKLDEYAYAVRQLTDGRLHEVPTGSGFIFFVKRKIFHNVGLFDEFNFPKGYGEENDFCQRLILKGYINIIDSRVYIFHKRSASFKDEKIKLIEASKSKLVRLHPTYKAQITKFIQDHPLQILGDKVKNADILNLVPSKNYDDTKQNILFIIHDGGGGSIHTNKDLVDGLGNDYNRFILLCGVKKWRFYDAQIGEGEIVKEFEFEKRWNAIGDCGHERLMILGLICRDYNIDITHFRSIIAIGPEALLHAKNLGLKVIFSLHDFIIICPTIQLIDNNDNYCGGSCSEGEGECKISTGWFGEIPNLKHDFVYSWRAKIQKYLPYCDKLITTSEYSKDLFLRHFSILEDQNIKLIQHGRDLSDKKLIGIPPKNSPHKVVIFGAMNVAKGTRLLMEIFAINEQRIKRKESYFEFHVFGNTDKEFATTKTIDGVVHHGAYERDQLSNFIAQVGPSYAMITSIWPETYCHTLSEAWLMGLPVFASDIGTIKERVETCGGAWLMDYTSSGNWYQKMLETVSDKQEYIDKLNQIENIKIKPLDTMVEDYMAVYQEVRTKK